MRIGRSALDCLDNTVCYPWGMFVNGIQLNEYAKLEYGRLVWRVPEFRERLLRHWRDPRHPHAERFAEHEADVRQVLERPKDSDEAVDIDLRRRGLSLRTVVKEIPSVFGSFY